jgi:hypothetical protein
VQKLLSVHYIYLIPLLAAALVSLRSFRLKWPAPFRQFSTFLLLTLFIELFAIYWKWYLHKTSIWNFSKGNIWIYDAFIIVKLLFFMWFYYQLLLSEKIKAIIRKSMTPLLILGILEYILIETPVKANIYTIAGGNLIIVLLSLSFFRQILKEAAIVKLKNNPAVIIASGALIYHSATTPLFLYINLLNLEQSPLAISYFYINHIFNIIMYSLYLISFLCKPSFQK